MYARMQELSFDAVFYEFETVGVRAPNCSCPEETMSGERKKAMDLFEASCKLLNGRYVIGLAWKKDPADLPNNNLLTKRRLESVEKSLTKNPIKSKSYANAINEYERNGWVRKLGYSEIKNASGLVYYLPHHGVYCADKEITPLRIVCKGPCLHGVLLRFKEEVVAFTGDIS